MFNSHLNRIRLIPFFRGIVKVESNKYYARFQPAVDEHCETVGVRLIILALVYHFYVGTEVKSSCYLKLLDLIHSSAMICIELKLNSVARWNNMKYLIMFRQVMYHTVVTIGSNFVNCYWDCFACQYSRLVCPNIKLLLQRCIA